MPKKKSIDKRVGSTKKPRKSRPYGGPKDPTQGGKFDAPKSRKTAKSPKGKSPKGKSGKTLKEFASNARKDAEGILKGLGSLGKKLFKDYQGPFHKR